MAKFIFKLAGVQRHREVLEEERKRDLAAAVAVKVAAETKLRDLDAVARKAGDELRSTHLIGTLNMSYLTAHRRFMFAIQRQAGGALLQLQQAEKLVETARTALAEAAKQRKIIEKLRDKQHARWAEAQAKKEAASSDEVAMQMSQMLDRDTTRLARAVAAAQTEDR